MSSPISNNQEVQTIGQIHHGMREFGPLRITYKLDRAIPQVEIIVSLADKNIGKLMLTPEHPITSIEGSDGMTRAEGQFLANFEKSQVEYRLTVAVFSDPIYQGKGILFGW